MIGLIALAIVAVISGVALYALCRGNRKMLQNVGKVE